LYIDVFNISYFIKNIGLPYKLVKSFFQVRKIFKRFKPDAAIGVGGYSSFPVLRYAQAKGIATFIHESNSFAGKTNILLGKKATRVFVAANGMEKFFPSSKLLVTGNPVRSGIVQSAISREEGVRFFSLNPSKKTVLIVGGSLGAKTINQAIDQGLEKLLDSDLQLIWQTGKPYAEKAKARIKGHSATWANEFITQMEYAYAAADIVVARAGAMTVAELSVVKKPVVFVPYPFAAEDHQTANAQQLVKINAALLVKDGDANEKLVAQIIELAADENRQKELEKSIGQMAITDADVRIAEEVITGLKTY
jgi:UDP-N-acetylglucosamine--N-acetylmuramyl-(pentapeptide) pyrophosphoryl-undecaprenol N-acetylglucosamine transferase